MSFLKKIFNKNKQQKEIKYSDDDYVRSKFIYHDGYGNNLIILLSFTQNYYTSAIELLSVSNGMVSKFIQTSVDTELDELDDDGNNKILSTPKNYLLIGGSILQYVDIYKGINYIGNPLLAEITKEIYENVNSDYLCELTNDGILNKDLFKYTNNNIIDSDMIYNNNGKPYMYYDSAVKIISKLPHEFTGMDIIKFIKVKDLQSHTYYPLIWFNFSKFSEKELNTLFNGLLNNITLEKVNKLKQPLYKQEIFDPNDIISGDLDSEYLDDIFKQQYEKFNCIVNDNISYEDIDEAISEDDPEYNMINSIEEEEDNE